jgi:ketosteroid isomerase-like protein
MTHTATIKNIYAGIANGDLKPLFDNFSQEAEWIEAENIPYSPGAPIVGPDGVVKAVFEKIGNDFSDFRADITRIVDGGSTVLVEGRYVGTTNTGNQLDAILAHVWDFDGDTIVRFQQYSDTWQWRKALGADA